LAIAKREAESGEITPLETMLHNMRVAHREAEELAALGMDDTAVCKEVWRLRALAQAAASDAAPFMHPRLSATATLTPNPSPAVAAKGVESATDELMRRISKLAENQARQNSLNGSKANN
jgi:hypothetical protein